MVVLDRQNAIIPLCMYYPYITVGCDLMDGKKVLSTSLCCQLERVTEDHRESNEEFGIVSQAVQGTEYVCM